MRDFGSVVDFVWLRNFVTLRTMLALGLVAAALLPVDPARSPAAAQAVSPSIYVGAGSYTNLGGELGLGTEVRFGRHLSANAAVGYLVEESDRSPDTPRRDYDVGFKLYPLASWLYLGLNYGLVDYWIDDRPGVPTINRTHAFSFTAGARFRVWRDAYLSAFAGTTSDAEANRFINDSFQPRLGVMLGYQVAP